MGDRLVEWDSNKAAINKKKHGISFQVAAKVFLDENRYTAIDEAHSDEELRYKTIGRVGKLLFVIYTERDEATRIISARRANKEERMIYYVSQNAYLSRDEIDF
ncbi:MAG: BrnT family toxin [Quinella sp. 1Q7]|nr:BrnT family toxin [Quinella sp. 1Q7]